MLFKVLENPFVGDLEMYLFQVTPGFKIVDVFFRQMKNNPQHVKLVVYYFLWH